MKPLWQEHDEYQERREETNSKRAQFMNKVLNMHPQLNFIEPEYVTLVESQSGHTERIRIK